MKRLFLVLAISIVTSTSHAAVNSPNFIITPLSKIMLSNLDADSASFTIYSPGRTSGICGVIMISTSGHEDFHDLSPLLSRFEISTIVPAKAPIVSKNFARFSFLNENIPQLYINTMKIKTKDGKSIAQNIKDLYKYGAPVVVTAGYCRQ